MIESLVQLDFHGGLGGTTWLQPVLSVERKAFISIAAPLFATLPSLTSDSTLSDISQKFDLDCRLHV